LVRLDGLTGVSSALLRAPPCSAHVCELPSSPMRCGLPCSGRVLPLPF
jgi:hypothetical protein